MSQEQIIEEILYEGLEDWVPIDTVIGWARETAPDEFKSLTTSVLEELLGNGWMLAGDIGDQGFEPRQGEWQATLQTLLQELEEMQWAPFGGGCWLANTEAGSEWVRRRRP
ncbi:hypothetical protein [Streptacidiphilus melanogenes]|uniref:hypothetical protein n=1 Tax=Streptacidiphilus melanogenes TaxID=411235 RepID=UPI0005AA3CFA|nr:hypothetical protein [Streptacidiphilus melanogenes]